MILVSKFLVPNGYTGLTLFPFIFLKYEFLRKNEILINHEKIHLRQQLEMLVVFFYLFYGIEFVVRLFQYKNWYNAYKNISFEREAYLNENDLNYLQNRRFWRFITYL